MTCKIKPLTTWRIGFFDVEEDSVLFYTDTAFKTPQSILDYLATEEGQQINLGPSGLIFVHQVRTKSSSTARYFHSFSAANKHQLLSRPA